MYSKGYESLIYRIIQQQILLKFLVFSNVLVFNNFVLIFLDR